MNPTLIAILSFLADPRLQKIAFDLGDHVIEMATKDLGTTDQIVKAFSEANVQGFPEFKFISKGPGGIGG